MAKNNSPENVVLNSKSLKVMENIYTSLAQNRVCKRINEFYCYTCKTQISNVARVIEHISQDDEHTIRSKIGNIDSSLMKDAGINEIRSAEIVLNGIVLTTLPTTYCMICCCSMPSIDHVSHHVAGHRHSKSKDELVAQINGDSVAAVTASASNASANGTKSTNSPSINVPPSKFLPHFKSTSNLNVNKSDNASASRSNDLPDINTKDQKSDSKSSSLKSNQVHGYMTRSNTEKLKEIQKKPFMIYYCEVCEMKLKNKAAITCHKMFHLHKENCSCPYNDVIIFLKQNDLLIHCRICDFKTNSEIKLAKHVLQSTHVARLKFLCHPKIFRLQAKSPSVPQNTLKKLKSDDCLVEKEPPIIKYLYCRTCDVICSDNISFTNHISGKKHNQNYQKTISGNPTIESFWIDPDLINSYKFKYICFICDIDFYDVIAYNNHINGEKHKNGITAINMVLQDKSIYFDYQKSIVLKCSVCCIIAHGIINMLDHINGNIHQQRSRKDEKALYYCPVCEVHLKDENRAIKHFCKKTHESKMSEQSSKDFIFSCPICAKNFNRDTHLLDHFDDALHKSKSPSAMDVDEQPETCSKTTEKRIENFNHSNDSISSLKTNKTQDKVPKWVGKFSASSNSFGSTVSLNAAAGVSKSSKNSERPAHSGSTLSLNLDSLSKKLPKVSKGLNTLALEDVSKKPSKVNFSRNNEQMEVDDEEAPSLRKNRMPRKPVRTISPGLIDSTTDLLTIYGSSYVERCLEPGDENMYRVDPAKLDQLKLSLSVTFPIGDETARYCLACKQNTSSDWLLFYEHARGQEHLEHLRKLVEYDSYFEAFDGQFSDLRLAKAHMSVSAESDELIRCFGCDETIPNEDLALKSHVESSKHSARSAEWKASAEEIFEELEAFLARAWYYAQRFVCRPCNVTCHPELRFVEHLRSSEHLSKVATKNDSLEFDLCGSCLTYWLGEPGARCDGSSHDYFLKSRSFLTPELPSAAKEILEGCASTVQSLVQLSDEVDANVEDEVLKAVMSVAARVFTSEVKVRLHGSRLAGLALPDSDLNVYLDCLENSDDNDDDDDAAHGENKLILLQEALIHHTEWTIEHFVEDTAESSILKLRHRPTKLCCDISCDNSLVVDKAKMLRCYNEVYPTCREMILFFRKWTNFCNLSVMEKFTTYAISMLVIFYLQTKDILPSVNEMFSAEGVNKADDDVTMKKKIVATDELLMDMFLYYANFDYVKYVIDPLNGKPLTKKQICIDQKSVSSLEKSNIDAKVNASLEWDILEVYGYPRPIFKHTNNTTEPFRFDCPMCVRDPIEPLKNVTKGVSKLQLRSFIEYCSESATIVSSKKAN